MRQRENYTPFVAIAFVLTLAIITSFQIYILREPARVAADEARDKSQSVDEGRSLFVAYCSVCHGKQGEGVDGPPLNDKQFLAETSDQTIFSLIGSGVPGSEMPAWDQSYGGPFTDQQVRQLVAFIRNWEPTAPDRRAEALKGDPAQGLVIFDSTCFICHGEHGQGTDRASALDDPSRLAQFDDEWYTNTIAQGRPAQGMPTWGTVLSPQQIRDLVALLRAWQRGETVNLPGPGEHLHNAAHALEQGEVADAEHHLEEAAQVASGEQLDLINQALDALKKGDTATAGEVIEKAESPDSGDEATSGANLEGSLQPGEAEAQAALEDLKTGMNADAASKLEAALGLAQGDSKRGN
jgi:ubiquinol-cytochrome c reductase cytochrome c subunit